MQSQATQRGTRGRRRIIQDEESASEVEKEIEKQTPSNKSKKTAKQKTTQKSLESQNEATDETENNTTMRRKLRKNYRILIEEVEAQKQELTSPTSEGLAHAIARSDRLYQKVNQPREAALDSEFLTKVSQLGREASSRVQTGFKNRDAQEFISKLRNYLRKGEPNIADRYHDTENQALADLEWLNLGQKFSSFMKRSPNISFIYGTLAIVPKPKKERPQRKEREKLAEKVVAEEIIDADSGGGLDKETSKRVTEVRDYLEKAKKINFFEFIIDPESFTHTIENIFHFSFLVKDGYASLTTDESGMPIAEPATQPESSDFHSGKSTRKQCIISFTYDDWKKMKEKLNITKPFLPKKQIQFSQQSPSITPTQPVVPSQNKQKKRLRKNQEEEDEDSPKIKRKSRRNNTQESMDE